MRKSFIIAYLIFLHLLIGAFVYRSISTRIQVFATDSSKIESPYTYYRDSRTVLERMDKNVPDGATIFLGDSLTESFAVSNAAAEAINFGIAGDSVGGLAQRLSDYQSLEKARAVVLLIGTNDAAFEFEDEQMAASLNELSSRLPSRPALLWYAVPPVDPRIDKTRLPERIRRINLRIKELCAARNNCRFIDLTESLADESGNLKSDYHIGDGYHFNERAYRIWTDSLKTQLPPR